MLQLSMLEATNKEIIEDTMIIDEADNLQDYLISNKIGNDVLSTWVEFEGMSVHKFSVLKHAII